MKSLLTSFNAMFGRSVGEAPALARVEIPLIQRDYAQGRESDTVRRIRSGFLDVLHAAVTGGEPVCLDFVYGNVGHGTLRPLDGQQRLTTLFLLHWYLSYRADRLDEEQGWKQFGYATRPSARLFCQRLTSCRPPAGIDRVSSWIIDQPWYLHTWRHDPSIASMLVMLDAMHERFTAEDCVAAWQRLVDRERPAISFHLLPIADDDPGDEKYIKMNSRGKPLTPFENFKAHFEQMLEDSCPDRVKEFALAVDGDWADLLWPYHGGDFIVDDEFLRYFRFVAELCEWSGGRTPPESLDELARRVFGPENPDAAEQLDFLFRAFNTWVGVEVAALFSEIFANPTTSVGPEPSKLLLFGQHGAAETNLFAGCCRSYGEQRGRAGRVFSLPNTLLLYAFLVHRLGETSDLHRRLRMIRNLAEASGNELRVERMPAFVADVKRIIVDGCLEHVSAFNQEQVADERRKQDLLRCHPKLQRALFELEDHPILRGALAAFEPDPDKFERRAAAFRDVFGDPECRLALTGALLATGDYSRKINARMFQLGSSATEAPWRELLTGAKRTNLDATRAVLARLLDTFAEGQGSTRERLEAISARFLATRTAATHFDWRYYFVKYSAMREGRSGIYAGLDGTLGYMVCMLHKRQMNSSYRDPYLLAIWRESGVGKAVHDPWFTGYETHPRWMRLVNSGTELRCVAAGLAINPPKDAGHRKAFERVCERHGVGEDKLLAVSQQTHDGSLVDASDRVQLGVALLRELVGAGL
jgi:hypothetical protein